MFGGLLAACGGDDDDDDEDTGGDDPEPTEPAAEDEEPTEADEEAEGEPTEADDDEEEPSDDGDARRGGRIVVANASQPTSLDMHQTTGGRTVSLIGWHMYESLFTWDAQYALTPQLAASYEASADATTHTIALRQGVPFHNGEEMKAADVIASVERWGRLAPNGQLLMASVEELVEVDEYTIEFRMTGPIATVPHLLARAGQGAAIYPKS